MSALRRAILGSAIGLGATLGASQLVGQQPVKGVTPIVAQPIAYIYGNVPISQEEFGKFLMDRGGFEKLELYVNKRIIEMEATRRGFSVTKGEMEIALNQDIAGLGGINKEEFLKIVLPKYNKTYYEWMEDVIKPRLLLEKMCRDRVKVSDEDLKIQFERRYGEQRQCQMILWQKKDTKEVLTKVWGRIRNDAAEFDSVARAQYNASLASTAGHIKPITKHLVGSDKSVEITAYQLKEGEVSQLIETPQGLMVLKLNKIIPPDTTKKYEEERPRLEKAAFDELLSREIPLYFAELKKAANPKLDYITPTEWQISRSTFDGIQSVVPTRSQAPVSPTPTTPNTGTTPTGLPPSPTPKN